MTITPVIEDAVAIVPVKDMQGTLEFYGDLLGFERRFVSDDKSFAIVVHGDAAIHFVQTDSEGALEATARNISIYLWVKHIDALYEELRLKLEQLPEGRVRPIFNQEYGMREFHLKDPDGCALLFGEET